MLDTCSSLILALKNYPWVINIFTRSTLCTFSTEKDCFLFNTSDTSHDLKGIFSDGVNVSHEETKYVPKGDTTEDFLADL